MPAAKIVMLNLSFYGWGNGSFFRRARRARAVAAASPCGGRLNWPAGGSGFGEKSIVADTRIEPPEIFQRIYEPPPVSGRAVVWAPAPQAEEFTPRQSRAEDTERQPFWKPNLAGISWLTIGFGLCVDGLLVTIAPTHQGYGLALFWVAIIVPFAVFATILMAAQPSPRLRIFLISAIGLYPSIMYRLSSPLVLGGYDEHLHEQELLNLLRGSGLFASNPMLAVGPNYPGLEVFTGALIRLSGVPVILGESLVVLLCRLLLVLTIYHAALTISPERRVASLAVIFYAVSPQFYFFNSQFAYQTMSLTLGLAGLFLLRRAQLADNTVTARRFSVAAILALLGTVVTHHLTSWIVLAFLVFWTLITPSGKRKILFRAASIMAVAVAGWTVLIWQGLADYLGPIFSADLAQFNAFIAGTSKRNVFGDAGGTGVTPLWERAVLILYALICTFMAVMVAWILIKKAFRTRDRILGLLAILCLASPITLATHFVPSAASLGDRASTFFFLPLALSSSLVVMRDPRVMQYMTHRRRRTSLPVSALIAVTSIAYIGGVMLGSGPDWQKIPGHYLVSADPRTQDPDTLAAVQWAAKNLPPGSPIVADRVPADLLASQARLFPVTEPVSVLEPASIYFSTKWTSTQDNIIDALQIRYIYVDTRLQNSLPHVGFYFYNGESLRPRRISAQSLTKFTAVHKLKLVYHNEFVRIYDTGSLDRQPVVDGFTGDHHMGLGTPADAALGFLAAGLAFLIRRRLRRLRPVFSDLGLYGTTIMLMSVIIFVAGILFALRAMPGPGFAAGAAGALVVLTLTGRLVTHKRLMPRFSVPPRLNLYVALGILLAAAGIAVAIRAAWLVDVQAVQAAAHSAMAGN